jgi:hypothetical protein
MRSLARRHVGQEPVTIEGSMRSSWDGSLFVCQITTQRWFHNDLRLWSCSAQKAIWCDICTAGAGRVSSKVKKLTRVLRDIVSTFFIVRAGNTRVVDR